MITKMQEESGLRTDAANERGKRVPLFGGCIAKGLQARSGVYIRQGETTHVSRLQVSHIRPSSTLCACYGSPVTELKPFPKYKLNSYTEF